MSSDTPTRPTGLDRQWAEVSEWLAGERAIVAAKGALVRRGVVGLGAEEVVGEAWIRLRVTFDQREEAYPVWERSSAGRLGNRAIDSTLVDLMRRSLRRPLPVAHLPEVPVGAVTDRIERLEAFRDVIAAINALAGEGLGCRGCAEDVVVAAALSVVHHVALGTDPTGRGDDPFGELVTVALAEVAGEVSGDAARQRRRRCGPCVRMLVERAMSRAGMDTP